MINGIFQSGSMPVVEKLVQFTGARHQVLTNNIANLSTPNFRPRDLNPQAFQEQLGEAVEQRRVRAARRQSREPFRVHDTRQVREGSRGGLDVHPEYADENILFHDRNNRDLERTMQDLAENTMAFSAGLTFLKSELDLLKTAIRGRL